MANVQLVKQRTAQTVTQTVMTQKQSQVMVQTMLHSALSSLAYVRGLFPSKAFDDRYYEMRDDVLPYEDFASANMPDDGKKAARPHTKLPVLRRGRSRRADKFLDWLENGAFSEIEPGNLRAVEILLNVDPKQRTAVLETYTFTIQYSDPAAAKRVPIGVHMGKPLTPSATVQSTNKALQMLVRGIDTMCKDMPELPKKRLLSMQLWYNNALPRPGNVTNFIPGLSDDLLFPKLEGWERQSTTMQLGSGCHRTAITISHMLDKTGGATATLSQTKKPAFTLLVPRASLLELPGVEEDRVSDTRVSTQERDPKAHPREVSRTLFAPGRQASGLLNGPYTQSSQIPQMHHALNSMLQPEELVYGDTQSQQAFKGPQADSATATPTTVRASSTRKNREDVLPAITTITLLPHVRETILSGAKSLRKSAQSMAAKVGAVTATGETILCACGHAKEEGHMVQCVVCSTWQHLHCYGYTGESDTRLPEDHYCYWCLLGKTDSPTFAILQTLAPQRRGLYFVNEHGMGTKQDLGRLLGMSVDEAGKLHAYLKNNAFVVAAANSKKQGFRATKQPLFVPVTAVAVHAEMFKTFFDPTAHLSKYYAACSAETLDEAIRQHRQQLLKTAANMPTAATPQQSARRNRVAETPGSRLDLPARAIPFKTPTLPAVGAKRKHDAQDVQDRAEKRHATVADEQQHFTMMSESLVDAGGESSPFSVHARSTRKSKR
ncbi:hypothetical protein B0A48_05498 [Cryoendolithus antarcticus]|uniref:HORMA domain-containing protein n=1 Tax=Cryoendolithus antarcticus TaxID=1507870 RepID=A0A1V8TJ52_9PEZI|nr:hypothetical protein B0A48_05498 [Cryoendolithus antarcticus]